MLVFSHFKRLTLCGISELIYTCTYVCIYYNIEMEDNPSVATS